jgi:DNA-binding NarL/FixJ family response regulator
MISIFIADDHKLFREGVSSLLSTIENFEISGEASNGNEVMELLKSRSTDVILMDINMPEKDGIETAEAVRSTYPEIKIIMLTMLTDKDSIERVLKIGVEGYLPKDAGKAELKEAITKVINGEKHYNNQVFNIIAEGYKSDNVTQAVRLTPREEEILKLICNELTTQEIADKLYISFNTVETHRKNLLHKTGSKNSLGLLKFAIENKLFKE